MLHPLAVDEGAVGALEIADPHLTIEHGDERVVAGDGGVREHHVVVRSSPDLHTAAVQQLEDRLCVVVLKEKFCSHAVPLDWLKPAPDEVVIERKRAATAYGAVTASSFHVILPKVRAVGIQGGRGWRAGGCCCHTMVFHELPLPTNELVLSEPQEVVVFPGEQLVECLRRDGMAREDLQVGIVLRVQLGEPAALLFPGRRVR